MCGDLKRNHGVNIFNMQVKRQMEDYSLLLETSNGVCKVRCSTIRKVCTHNERKQNIRVYAAVLAATHHLCLRLS